jgi:pyruvate carboxylase
MDKKKKIISLFCIFNAVFNYGILNGKERRIKIFSAFYCLINKFYVYATLNEGRDKNMEATISAHMPGLVARVIVGEGDHVSKGETVAVINCMKTELAVISEHDGKVKQVLVKEWDEMDVGSPMIILESNEVK